MNTITDKVRLSFGIGTVVAVLCAAFYFGGDNQAIKSSIAATIAVQQARQEEVNRRLEKIEEKLDKLIHRLIP
jgi:flavin-dependent dehydrogenase